MDAATEFARRYTADQRGRIRFAWNGKHAVELHDDNQEFRRAVVDAVLLDSAESPIELLRDLLEEEALWSHEAWCAPDTYPDLLTVLLRRGGPAALPDFAAAMSATFDTFGSAHTMALTPDEARRFREESAQLLAREPDERRRTQLQMAVELFEKLQAGTATEGWAVVPPGTPVLHPSVRSSRVVLRESQEWIGAARPSSPRPMRLPQAQGGSRPVPGCDRSRDNDRCPRTGPGIGSRRRRRTRSTNARPWRRAPSITLARSQRVGDRVAITGLLRRPIQ